MSTGSSQVMHVLAPSVVSAAPRPREVGSEAASGPSTILFIVWPEPGHVAGPLALARRLQARGDRVVFAGLPEYRPFIERQGHEFRSLAAPPNHPPGPSVFACPRGKRELAEAVGRLLAAFEAVCVEYAPGAVLIDSLYSAFTLLPAARGLPWATYETDLPRELDLGSPPLPVQRLAARQAPAPEDSRIRRSEWARLLWATYRQRRSARQSPAPGQFSMQSDFPDRLSSALGARVGRCVAFDRRSAFTPVAKGPRLVFSSEVFDFVRTRRHGLTYVGPCIDTERSEPAFDWSRLPGRELVYCSLGTQSFREAQAPALLRTIIAALGSRPDLFLVVACPARFTESLTGDPERVALVKHAPQLALLRRSRLAITHAGFNGVKECALFGVPQLVLPLSHDQPRNAALVERLGIGIELRPNDLTVPRLLQAIDDTRANRELEQRCQAIRRRLEADNAQPAALDFVDRLVLGQRPTGTPRLGRPPTGTPRLETPSTGTPLTERRTTASRRSSMNPSVPETPQSRAVRLSCATPRFERIADELVRSVRRAMGVPDQAESDVEEEFAALRATLDGFYPEFTQLFSGLLSEHLGAAQSVVLASLESEPIQAYLQAADAIDADVNACLRGFVSRIGAALGAAAPS